MLGLEFDFRILFVNSKGYNLDVECSRVIEGEGRMPARGVEMRCPYQAPFLPHRCSHAATYSPSSSRVVSGASGGLPRHAQSNTRVVTSVALLKCEIGNGWAWPTTDKDGHVDRFAACNLAAEGGCLLRPYNTLVPTAAATCWPPS